MSSHEVKIGQQLQRTDAAGLIFEVVEPIASFGPPHMRVRRVDDPTDTRVFAVAALSDRHRFRTAPIRPALTLRTYVPFALSAS